MREDLDVASAMIGDGEFEPAMSGQIDLLGIGDRGFIKNVVGLT